MNSCCGSIFISHCSHKDLIQHYHEIENAMELDSTLLLHLGMDGPNVNKKFANVLISETEEEINLQGTEYWYLLHSFHISF